MPQEESAGQSGGAAPFADADTVVHLLRHGKVQNPEGILYGTLPGYRLARSGEAMAAGVAEHLRGADIGFLATSSLQRAQQTVAPLADMTGVPVSTDDRLIEAGNAFAGTRFALSSLARPSSWKRMVNPRRPSWGEPYLDIARRMLGAVTAAEVAARGRVAVLVSHQLPIWTVRRFLAGQRLWHNPAVRECALASLTTLYFSNGVLVRIGYSEPVAHIAAVDDPVTPGDGGTRR